MTKHHKTALPAPDMQTKEAATPQQTKKKPSPEQKSYDLEAWLKRVKLDPEFCIHNLRPFPAGELAKAAESLLADTGWIDNPEHQLKQARAFAEKVAQHDPYLYQNLKNLKSGRFSALYIKGLPVTDKIQNLVCLGITSILGHSFNYAEQQPSGLVMPLYPDPNSGDNTNASPNSFKIHTDDSAMLRAARAHYLCLLGINNPEDTLTGYASLSDALEFMITQIGLDDAQMAVDILMKAHFQVRVPSSFKLGREIWTDWRAIITVNSDGILELAYPSYATRAKDKLSQDMLDKLTFALQSVQTGFPLHKGAMIAFSNLRGAHSRTKIPAGKPRLILRSYATESLDTLKQVTQSKGPIFRLIGHMDALCDVQKGVSYD